MYSSMTRKLTAFFLLAGMIVTASLALAGTTELVSVSSSGVQGNGNPGMGGLSADGRYILFYSEANNLVDDDTNGHPDVFVRDRQTGETERVNVSSAGAQANNYTSSGSISGDGRFVAFDSRATNLVAGDTNSNLDVFLRDRTTRTTERISVGPGGIEADGWCWFPQISADGRFVTFSSMATNLVPGVTYGYTQTYVYDRVNKTTELVSKSNFGIQGNGNSLSVGAISADGRYIAFSSYANNLVPNDTNGYSDVFVYDRVAKTIENVNVSVAGVQGGGVASFSLSADGRFIAFNSSGLVPGLSGGWLYLRDRQNNTIKAVTGWGSNSISLSGDGRFLAYSTDRMPYIQVIVYDQLTETSEAISVTASGSYGNNDSWGPNISADGSIVAFGSNATDLVTGDTNGLSDAFVRDRSTIQILDALFNYRTDLLTVEATSNSGAADNLSVVGFGPMTWNAATGTWQLTATNVAIAPQSITVTGNSGSRIIQ